MRIYKYTLLIVKSGCLMKGGCAATHSQSGQMGFALNFMTGLKNKFTGIKSKKRHHDRHGHIICGPHKKSLLSAGAVFLAGGILVACVMGKDTSSYKNSFLSDSRQRDIINDNYDYEKADDHYIVMSDKKLKKSDGFVSVGDGLYLVGRNVKTDKSLKTFKDGDITVADAGEGSGNGLSTGSEGSDAPIAGIKKDNGVIENKLARYMGTLTAKKEVKVAVLDSGAYFDDKRILPGENYAATGGSGTTDDNGHGSSVIKLITENTPDSVKIIPVKVVDSTGHGTILSLYKGIKYAVAQKADIINISLVSSEKDSELIHNAVSDAKKAGIKVIVAAGNKNRNISAYTPANIDSAVTVAAVTENNSRAAYSNYGDVDYAASGVFEKHEGTSFSTAYVTAAAAKILSGDKKADIESIFSEYAYIPDGLDKKYIGNGVISLDKTIVVNNGKTDNLTPVADDNNEIKSDDVEIAGMEQYCAGYYVQYVGHANPNGDCVLTTDTFDGVEYSAGTYASIGTCTVEYANTQGWWYQNSAGWWFTFYAPQYGKYVYPVNTWLGLKSGANSPYVYYFFDAKGYCLQNQFVYAQNHLTPSFDKSVQSWFYFDSSGAMIKGWQHIWTEDGPHYYYFRNDGSYDPYIADGSNLHYAEGSEISKKFTYVAKTTMDAGTDAGNNRYPYYISDFNLKVCDSYEQKDGTYSNEYRDEKIPITSLDSAYKLVGAKDISANNKRINPSVNYIYEGEDPVNTIVSINAGDYGISYSVSPAERGDSTCDLKFVYRWPAYKVSYYANTPVNDMTSHEGFGVTGSVDSQSCKYGNNVRIADNGYTLPGYEFTGWNTNPDGSGTSYKAGYTVSSLTYKNGDKIKLYAQWKPKQYKITFNLNGGTSDTVRDITADYGSDVPLPADPVKGDKSFVGWSVAKDDISTSIQSLKAGFSYVNARKTETEYYKEPSDITLYALYSIPVSDVTSMQMQIWHDGSSKADYTSDIAFSDEAAAGYHSFFSPAQTVKIVQILNSSGGKYMAYDDFRCNMGARIIATDNAGNTGTIWNLGLTGSKIPDPEYDKVSTEHYLYSADAIGIDASAEYYGVTKQGSGRILKGSSYKPAFMTENSTPAIPDGYEPTKMTMETKTSGINTLAVNRADDISSVTVNEDTRFKAYYSPKHYRITFKTVQGEKYIEGSGTSNPMDIYYRQTINALPTAEKTGYIFSGWDVLDKDNVTNTNEQIHVGDKYEYKRNITVVPHWTIGKYKINYDAASNGGELHGTACDEIEYNSVINTLEHYATKGSIENNDYFEFVGWNTSPTATTAGDDKGVLTNNRMPDHDITFYAIYKRTVTANFYSAYSNGRPDDIADCGRLTDVIEATYYNNDKYGTITAPDSKNGVLNWGFIGWAMENNYDSPVAATAGSIIHIDKSTDFYGIYEKVVTLTYKTNDVNAIVESASGKAMFNAAPKGRQGQAKKNFEGKLDDSLKNNETKSFVCWIQTIPAPDCPVCGNPTEDSIIGTVDVEKNGCNCRCFYPNSGYAGKRQSGCTCCFMAGDAFSIDRDTTVAARWDAYPVICAKDTYITNKDKPVFEKKLLESADGIDNEDVTTSVTVQNRDEIKEVINSTDENIDVTVIYKTTDSYGNITIESKMLHVVNTAARDVEKTSYSRFINKKMAVSSVSFEKGGLEENSIWVKKQSYSDALNTALANAENVKAKKMDTANSYLLGNGKAYKPQYVLKYTYNDIQTIKKYLKDNGYGKFQDSTDMESGSVVLGDYFNKYVKKYEQ